MDIEGMERDVEAALKLLPDDAVVTFAGVGARHMEALKRDLPTIWTLLQPTIQAAMFEYATGTLDVAAVEEAMMRVMVKLSSRIDQKHAGDWEYDARPALAKQAAILKAKADSEK